MHALERNEKQDVDVENGAISGVREVQKSKDLREETILTEDTIRNVVDVLRRACRH